MGLLSRKEQSYWIGRGMSKNVLFARWTCFYKKTNNIGWDGVCGRMTLFVRCVFVSERNNIIEWGGLCGRTTLFARWAFFNVRQLLSDAAEYVDE